MPELPEIETIKKDIEKKILGKKIVKVEINTTRMIRGSSRVRFKKEVEGERFKQVIRRGKYLILGLSSGKSIIVHLRMSGQLVYGKRHQGNRVCFLLSDGQYLNLNDKRHLGELKLVRDWEKEPAIQQMGVEPLNGDLSLGGFASLLAIRRGKIKPLLMNQRFLAGVGNIYAQEALFRAGVHPERAANSLTHKEVKLLYTSLIDTLREAVRYRGTSVRSYVDGEGRRGEFAFRLRVYGRRGQPCMNCGAPLQFVRISGRGTNFCPKCQQ